MPEQIVSAKVIARGGLDSSENYLELSETSPGSASELLNFEPSLFGGYRRINGFQAFKLGFEFVDPTNAEGPILCTAIYKTQIIVARKQKSGNTYKFYSSTGGAGWTAISTGLTHNSLLVDRIRWKTFNFNGTEKIEFVDGQNKPVVYDGTTWAYISGDQEIDKPRFIALFKNTVFNSGSRLTPNIVTYSDPLNESGMSAAAGAGQVVADFEVTQIYPFRDELYVFGFNKIKKIVLEGTDFVLKDVATNIGCISPDSVQEINGDLVFLSQDGIRPISATDKIGDIQLASISKRIQQNFKELITNADLEKVSSLVIRSKSQVRFFFSDDTVPIADNRGVLGALRSGSEGEYWEWAEIKGIRSSVCTSGYIGPNELIIHGDYTGGVYVQEVGGSFNGQNIPAIYQTTYLDFGETQVRKTMRTVNLFIRPEGAVTIMSALKYDWGMKGVQNPASYATGSEGDSSIYGQAIYGQSTYGGATVPVMVTNVEGSGKSVRLTLSTQGTEAPYTIQGIVFEFAVDGRI